jgi:hypothetical protein
MAKFVVIVALIPRPIKSHLGTELTWPCWWRIVSFILSFCDVFQFNVGLHMLHSQVALPDVFQLMTIS